jgi:hypothetical protein
MPLHYQRVRVGFVIFTLIAEFFSTKRTAAAGPTTLTITTNNMAVVTDGSCSLIEALTMRTRTRLFIRTVQPVAVHLAAAVPSSLICHPRATFSR